MNIKIDRELLLKPLGNVSGIVEKRHALPILSNLIIRRASRKLKFTATDLECKFLHTLKQSSDDFK